MKSFALGDDGDLLISGGKGSLVEGDQAIAQRIVTRTRLYLGENRYDQEDGFPWLEEIFVGKLPPSALLGRLKQYWLDTDGVESVDNASITVNPKTRRAVVTAIFNGSIPVEVTI